MNLISIACLADQFKDDDKTFIWTARFHSDFTWNFGKHSKTIHHAQSRIPEVEVTTSKGSLQGFATAINYLDPRSHHQVFNANLIDDDEDKEITVSSNTPKQPLPKSTSVIPEFVEGDDLIYCRDGHVEKVKLQSSHYSDNIYNYSVQLHNGSVITTTREFLRPADEHDNITIPSTLQDYKALINELDDHDIRNLIHPKPLSLLETEFLDTHNRLQHMPSSEMFNLSIHGHLPKRFLKLKNKPPPCLSCILGKLQRRKWRTKGANDKNIRKLHHNKPGKCTSIDQIVSAQPGLVPRMSGRHTRDRITSATCFLDHKSSFGYSHLCTSTTQEETINAKAAYEKLASTHGVTVEAYHADNGRFAEKGFREAVSASN